MIAGTIDANEADTWLADKSNVSKADGKSLEKILDIIGAQADRTNRDPLEAALHRQGWQRNASESDEPPRWQMPAGKPAGKPTGKPAGKPVVSQAASERELRASEQRACNILRGEELLGSRGSAADWHDIHSAAALLGVPLDHEGRSAASLGRQLLLNVVQQRQCGLGEALARIEEAIAGMEAENRKAARSRGS